MSSIGYYCDPQGIEPHAHAELQRYAQQPAIGALRAFTDIHYCAEKALPVGVAFAATNHVFPLVTGKDIGCGVMYLRIGKEHWRKLFDKRAHFDAWQRAHGAMTDDGLGGGNHFLSLEEDDEAVYVICHTGTRNRGIALYQRCVELCRQYAQEAGGDGESVPAGRFDDAFRAYYTDTLRFGYARRKAFCLQTMAFLQGAQYVGASGPVARDYGQGLFAERDEEGRLHGTPYRLGDSVHNHLRFDGDTVLHRKGSTELVPGRTAVLPLSMSRGSLLVTATGRAGEALWSCAHGAGRKLSRFAAQKHWRTVLKEKERRAYRAQFPELLGHNGEFPKGTVQELDYAYKPDDDIFRYQPYLRLVTRTRPIATIKYTEI
ncbi:RtcB family protein [Flaviaesturariibacter amylovorans]|uniref:3'-phosphate/5'-hydroxy nucleic acid ligase n=1 Tax=Flaviaesturariibacter amylovorans TaxID=1084520 RepID=A0ABP8HNH6_9BACT